MDDLLPKPIIEVATSNETYTAPVSNDVRIEDIYGMFPIVTSAPTRTPQRFMDGFAIDTTNKLFYYYDFTNNVWVCSNKKRTVTVTQSATPAINTDKTDVAHITGLAQAITSFTTNLTGTPKDGDTLIISITDNGTARAITWGASFESSGNVILPTTTVLSVRLDVGFLWNTVTTKWRCCAVA